MNATDYGLIDYMNDGHTYLNATYTEACAAAVSQGWTLNTYTDPSAEGVENCSAEYAAEVARDDANLVYLTKAAT